MPTEQERRELFPQFMSALDCVDWGRPVPTFSEEYLNQLVTSYKSGVSRRQIVISYTKWMHDFNVTDGWKDLEFLQGELEEAKLAWRTQQTEGFLNELADITIYCYGIAQMMQTDLDAVIDSKMRYNIQRGYTPEGRM